MSLDILKAKREEIRKQIVELQNEIRNNKRYIYLKCNALYLNKRNAYKLLCEIDTRPQWESYLTDRQMYWKQNEYRATIANIENDSESVKEFSKIQRELTYKLKDAQREFSKLDSRIKRKEAKDQ